MNGRDTNDLWLEVAAQPGPFRFPLRRSAIIMIDMQRDFILPGGFGATLGNDVAQLAGAVPVARRLLDWGRARGLLIAHTREAHAPDLSDCPPAKRNRGNPALRIGDIGAMGRILIDGEEGSDFVPELAPRAGEITLVKPGKGAFYATNLGEQLQTAGITHLILGGVTTEVCVQTTMREANDRGYECLLIEDATASYFPIFKDMTLAMLRAQGGIVGWTAPLAALAAGHAGSNSMNDATDDIAEYVRAALALHALELDDARRAAVTRQFILLAAMAELFLAEPPLSDTPPAPVYRL